MAKPDQIINLTLNQPGDRLDIGLTYVWPEYAKAQWKKFALKGWVMVDGRQLPPDYRLPDAEVEVVATIPAAQAIYLLPEAGPLNIVYEDKYLIVLNKPSGIIVHPALRHRRGTLLNWVLAHCDPPLPLSA